MKPKTSTRTTWDVSDDGGEWRQGYDRWHLPSGELRQRATTTDASTTTAATSASTDNPTSSSSATWGGDDTQNDNPTPSSSATRENQVRKGFYRHGEWVDRERTQEELRRHAGGQGTTRQARRLARVQEYARGEWVPAWLRDYRRGKEERDRERHRYDAREGDGGQDESWKSWGDWKSEPDHAELWQQGRGRLHARGDVYASEESDEVGFMDKPGLKGEEKELLRRGGVAQEHVDGLDHILRQYERYCSNDLGSEARWALGMWLAQSQIGADVQDLAETFIADRAQSPVCFPNRREPSDPHLRLELVRWANELSPIMTSIYGEATMQASPGRLVDMVESSSSSSQPRWRRSTPRSRSPRRRPTTDADVNTLLEEPNDGDRSSLMEMPPEDTDTDRGEDDEDEVDDGAGAGPMPDLGDDTSMPADEEGYGGYGDHSDCAASEDMLAGGLGGQDGDGLRSDFQHYMDTNSEGNIYVDRVYEIERTVRNELHAVRGATAREIARRLLARQGVMMDIVFHLQRALDLALRICPASSDGRPPVGALAGETAIWRKITGLYPDVRHVTELGAAMEAHLRRREHALREAEEELQRWRAAQAGTGTGGGRPLHPAKARPHPPGPGRHEVDRSRNPSTRPRPSVAPHLVDRPDLRPPCLRPRWERSVAELADSSGRTTSHSPDPPRLGGAEHAVHGRGAHCPCCSSYRTFAWCG